MPKSIGPRAPRTKTEFLNRILSIDFNGDLRDLFPEGVNVERSRGHSVMLVAKNDPDARFQIVVRKPRTEEQLAAMREKQSAKPRVRRRPKRASAGAMAASEAPGKDGAQRH